MNYKKKAVISTIGIALVMSFAIVSYSGVVLVQEGLCELKGYSPSQFSLFFTFYSAGGIVINFFLGKIIMKIGPKLTVLIGSFATLFGFGMLTVVNHILMVYAVAFLFGILVNMPSFVTYNIFVSSWFRNGRGKMMSIGTLMMNLISIFGVPVIASFYQKLGVIGVCWTMGGCFTAVSVVIGLLTICNLPDAYGTQPVDIQEKQKKETADRADVPELHMPASHCLKHPVTILCLITPAVASIGSSMYQAYSVMIYQNCFALSYMDASFCMSTVAAASAVLAPVFGILCDRLGVKKSIVLYALITAAGCAVIPNVMSGWAGAIAFAVFIGFNCYMSMISGLVIPAVYGVRQGPQLIGWSGTINGIGGAFAAPMAMRLMSINGNYANILLGCAFFFALSAVFTVTVMSRSAGEKLQAMDRAYLASAKN